MRLFFRQFSFSGMRRAVLSEASASFFSHIRSTAVRVAAWLLLVGGPLLPPAQAQSVVDSPEGLFQSGMSQFTAGNYEQSIEHLNQLVQVFGREPELRTQIDLAMYAQACAYYNLGKYAEAIKAFDEYQKQFPDSKFVDEAFFRMGSAQQMLEEYELAIAAYRQLRSRFPRSAFAEDALYQIGMCQLIQEQSPLAAATFQDFLNLYPKSPLWGQAGAFCARALFDNGKGKEAIDLLETLEQHPRTWSVITYCNFLAFEIGDFMFDDTEYELALKAYRRVKPLKALLRHQQDHVRNLLARMEALSSARMSPADIQSRFQAERRAAGDLAQAQEMLKKLEELPDYDANLYHRIGRCFFNTDRFWEALTAFTRVVDIATDETVKEASHFDLILTLSRLRRYDDLLIEADDYLATYDTGGKWE
ncbi:MAG: tetratricopeptide repeat protein [Verrucomicrobiota bacterium]|jgi:tetratricopeptide (TPR) repeat protein|nr:tetratricopeptide repeat protein [Verrucomicrobiota bacterium]